MDINSNWANIQGTPATSGTPILRPTQGEPLVPVSSESVRLGEASAPLSPRISFVPVSLARALVKVPQLGVACPALGPVGASLSQVNLVHELRPQTPQLSSSQAVDSAINTIVQSNPDMAEVKTALFQILRERQPMSLDQLHAANHFIDAGRSPHDVGLRVLSLAKLPPLSADQLHAMTDYADRASGTEGVAVRLHALPRLMAADRQFSPAKFDALNDVLSEGYPDNRLDLVTRAHTVSRGQLSADGIRSFSNVLFDGDHPDIGVRRDAAMHMAANNLFE